MSLAGKSLRDQRWEEKKLARDARLRDISSPNLQANTSQDQISRINGRSTLDESYHDKYDNQIFQEKSG